LCPAARGNSPMTAMSGLTDLGAADRRAVDGNAPVGPPAPAAPAGTSAAGGSWAGGCGLAAPRVPARRLPPPPASTPARSADRRTAVSNVSKIAAKLIDLLTQRGRLLRRRGRRAADKKTCRRHPCKRTPMAPQELIGVAGALSPRRRSGSDRAIHLEDWLPCDGRRSTGGPHGQQDAAVRELETGSLPHR
jgi:hypothetical protein